MGERSVGELQEHLDQEIQTRVPGVRRMFPYVRKHEFKGLFFSDTAAFGEVGQATEQDIEALAKIRRQFPTPEEINDHPEGAPSKRLIKMVRGYNKTYHGPIIAHETGLKKIREECHGFTSGCCVLKDWHRRFELPNHGLKFTETVANAAAASGRKRGRYENFEMFFASQEISPG